MSLFDIIWAVVSNSVFWTALEAIGTIGATVVALHFGYRARQREKREFHLKFIDKWFPDLSKAIKDNYEHNIKVIEGEETLLHIYGEITELDDYGRLGTIKYIDRKLYNSMLRVMTTLNLLILSLDKRRTLIIKNTKRLWTDILLDRTLAGEHRGYPERSLASDVFEKSANEIFKNNLDSIKEAFNETMNQRFKSNEDYRKNPYPDVIKEKFIEKIQGVIEDYIEDLNKIKKMSQEEIKDSIIPKLDELISNPP